MGIKLLTAFEGFKNGIILGLIIMSLLMIILEIKLIIGL